MGKKVFRKIRLGERVYIATIRGIEDQKDVSELPIILPIKLVEYLGEEALQIKVVGEEGKIFTFLFSPLGYEIIGLKYIGDWHAEDN